ncbi:MAG: hypothetical protein ACRC06_10640 [Waterburya sp.]
MTDLSWKKIIVVTLGIFTLFWGSVGLTGCEVEQPEAPTEQDD